MKFLILSLSLALLFAGCSSKPQPPEIDKARIEQRLLACTVLINPQKIDEDNIHDIDQQLGASLIGGLLSSVAGKSSELTNKSWELLSDGRISVDFDFDETNFKCQFSELNDNWVITTVSRNGESVYSQAEIRKRIEAVFAKIDAQQKAREQERSAELAEVKASALMGEAYYGQCIACHGTEGQGGIGPRLYGRAKTEITAALRAYRSGEAIGSQSAMMWPVSKPMTDQDIEHLADYISNDFPSSVPPQDPMRRLSFDELMTRGKEVYDASCLACHGYKGEGGLGNAIAGSSIALGPVSKHISVVANGVAGTAMQAFGDQLSSLDLAAVTTYQRNAFGNNTGDIVQASDLQRSKKAISEKSSMPDEAKYAGCAACHGPAGNGGIGPKLAGRDVDYITSRLRAYRTNEMVGPQSPLMWGQAAVLSDGDISDLANYIANFD